MSRAGIIVGCGGISYGMFGTRSGNNSKTNGNAENYRVASAQDRKTGDRYAGHSLTVTERKGLSVTGIEGVSAFSPVKIVLVMVCGEKIVIEGADLKITAFQKENGIFEADGRVISVKYGGGSLGAKIFR